MKSGYHHGDLRRALVTCAIEALVESGVSALSLRDVARRAGVSQTAPYRHFRDKEALLAAVAAHGFQAFGDAMARAADAESEERKLLAIGRAYVVFALENPALFRLMFGPEIVRKSKHPNLAAAASAAFGVLAGIGAATAARGQDSSGDPPRPSPPPGNGPDPPICAWANWSVAHGLAMLLLDGQIAPPEGDGEARDAFIEAVLRGRPVKTAAGSQRARGEKHEWPRGE